MAVYPSQTTVKGLLAWHGYSQAKIARRLDLSPGTFADLLNHGKWPVGRPTLRQEIAHMLYGFADTDGTSRANADTAVAKLGTPPANHGSTRQNARRDSARRSTAQGTGPGAIPSTKPEKETDMLLQKQTLAQATRRHFGMGADPFANDIAEATDVFVSPDIRYVRETLWQHTRHGGLLALVGESGSGKSTTVADYKDRLQREGRDVAIIEPSVLYMEENDSKGKTLKSASIVNAIIHTVAPAEAPRRDPEARARQVQRLLSAGHRAGQRHVLIIEEAHCLPTATLKHLKRFAELKDGLAPLLSIVLVGQPELRQRLAVNNAEVREVAQRCDIIELPPLDNHLAEYLKFKLARVGCEVGKVITPDGIDALRERLTFARRTGNAKAQMQTTPVSLVYPLAVANALTAAMNLAATLGAPVVDADIVKDA
jgi:type II secretory pathway predicted ATPase ExeA